MFWRVKRMLANARFTQRQVPMVSMKLVSVRTFSFEVPPLCPFLDDSKTHLSGRRQPTSGHRDSSGRARVTPLKQVVVVEKRANEDTKKMQGSFSYGAAFLFPPEIGSKNNSVLLEIKENGGIWEGSERLSDRCLSRRSGCVAEALRSAHAPLVRFYQNLDFGS